MATAIRHIPTLYGAEAERFLHAAEVVEANPGMVDLSIQAQAVRKYLQTQNWH